MAPKRRSGTRGFYGFMSFALGCRKLGASTGPNTRSPAGRARKVMEALLSLRGVSAYEPRGRRHAGEALSEVSLDLWAGEVLGVLAVRGVSRMTFLRVVAATRRPNSGRVLFGGRDLTGLSAERRSRLSADHIGLARIGEAPALDVPVLEHVAMGLQFRCGRRERRRRSREALERIGLQECSAQRWGALSNRERALVAVARGTIHEPGVLLVDDAGASLSIEESDEIGLVLRSLAKERDLAVLAIISVAAQERWADRTGVLCAGRLEVSGEPKRRRDNVVALRKRRSAGAA
jgi:ABC-type methionine transport system ATPase subunit